MGHIEELDGRLDAVLQSSKSEGKDTPERGESVARLRNRFERAREADEILRDPDHPNFELVTAPDWHGLAADAESELVQGGPNLSVAAGLVEALARLHGFAGAAAGVRFLALLIDQDWERLTPRPEGEVRDEAFSRRLKIALGPLRPLSEELLPRILTEQALFRTPDNKPYSYASLQHARGRSRLEARLAKMEAENQAFKLATRTAQIKELEQQLTLPEWRPWEGVVRQALPAQGEFLASRVAELRLLRDRLDQFVKALAAREAVNMVGTGELYKLLSDILTPLTPFLPQPAAKAPTQPVVQAAVPTAPSAGAPVQPIPTAQPTTPVASGGAVTWGELLAGAGARRNPEIVAEGDAAEMTREAALAKLTEIADFFYKTEPQSPIGPAIDAVVNRAKMSFIELAREIFPEEDKREELLLRFGIGLRQK